MSSPRPRRNDRAPRGPRRAASRRLGYAIAVAVDAVLLYAANVSPGWHILPFLTEDTSLVLPIVNLSLIAGIITNLVCLVLDRTWVKALADLVTLGIGLAVLAQLWQVFPFDFHGYPLDWAAVVRVLLVVAAVGSAIGIIVQFVVLIRTLTGLDSRKPGSR